MDYIWIIIPIIIIFLIAGNMEVFSISKRQKQLDEKLEELHKDLKEVLNKIDKK
ncbi:hypothetical protein SAMN05216389_102211 [Oceanobacillus limi]|uniref:Uncharacterized protein n=1 Tax=Oceanobacillus limi TaxID=930131 RepID=A0A1H9ZFR3_9BACI|nr:hypothetical protein SAMN05216389_102211 [Oceanobacillus limi]